jgi:hypothetical protein
MSLLRWGGLNQISFGAFVCPCGATDWQMVMLSLMSCVRTGCLISNCNLVIQELHCKLDFFNWFYITSRAATEGKTVKTEVLSAKNLPWQPRQNCILNLTDLYQANKMAANLGRQKGQKGQKGQQILRSPYNRALTCFKFTVTF